MMTQVVSLLLLFGPGNSVREDGWVASANGNRVARWGCATLEIIGVVPTEDEPVSFKARRYARGRVPTDMVTKAIRARIPVLVSKSVATDKTVEIARSLNLTLICKATPQSIDVLCDSACCADF